MFYFTAEIHLLTALSRFTSSLSKTLLNVLLRVHYILEQQFCYNKKRLYWYSCTQREAMACTKAQLAAWLAGSKKDLLAVDFWDLSA